VSHVVAVDAMALEWLEVEKPAAVASLVSHQPLVLALHSVCL
jgi:hypothetical protein